MTITREVAQAFGRCRAAMLGLAYTHEEVSQHLRWGSRDIRFALDQGALTADEAEQAKRDLLEAVSKRRHEIDAQAWEMAA